MRLATVVISLALGFLFLLPSRPEPPSAAGPTSQAEAKHLLRRQTAPFVPNLGQWEHPARFVRGAGPMTAFVEDRGWLLQLQEPGKLDRGIDRNAFPRRGDAVDDARRAVAVRMTFLDTDSRSRLVGEEELPGYSNYFLGNDESRWRTDVPHYSSVRYEWLYPGIDVRLRQQDGHLEYDLLCDPGADLPAAIVAVEGADGLRIDGDGSLMIDTALGPIRQPKPSTWEVLPDGTRRTIDCEYRLLGDDRFGFAAADWDGTRALVLDPGLLWSTFLGGSDRDRALAVSVDAGGIVTVAGRAQSIDFPTTVGIYDPNHYHAFDIFVSRLDPSETGSAQLIYSTYLGGVWAEAPNAISVDAAGVVTLAGETVSPDFPTTFNAFDRSHDGHSEAFVSRLDPNQPLTAELVFSTYLGGSSVAYTMVHDLAVDANGLITVAGQTTSEDFPTTTGAYDRKYAKGVDSFTNGDAFVSRFDPSKAGSEQLIWSTLLGHGAVDAAHAVAVEPNGVVTVVGRTSSPEFPTTRFAIGQSFGGVDSNGIGDAFVTRLDPSKFGSFQLLYSTFLGGIEGDSASAVSVDNGVVTVGGTTRSENFPTTPGAFDRVRNGIDVFVTRLDPEKTGFGQILYSTYLGGPGRDGRALFGVDTVDLSVDSSGVVTVSGQTVSRAFPTTRGAALEFSSNNKGDIFVSRLNPGEAGNSQLVYSTLFGGADEDVAYDHWVDASGTVTIVGETLSSGFRTTSGAYDREYNGVGDGFITQIELQPALIAYGTGIEGSGGYVPTIGAVRGKSPRIGSDFEIELSGLLGGASGVIAGSFAPAETRFGGLTLYADFVTPGAFAIWGFTATSPVWLPPGQPGAGKANLVLPIPDDPALIGWSTYWQGFVVDSGSPLPIGVSHTGGLEVIFVH